MDPSYDHGTKTSGVIGALTNNYPGYPGIASCSPGIKILPIYRQRVGNSMEKAINALRFHFQLTGGSPKETQVRVVNISDRGKNNEMIAQKEIDRDISAEKRFYVASAGNEATYGLFYPAAYDKVMGVTGMMGQLRAQNMQETLTQHPNTNYYNTTKYPCSAFYGYNFYPSPGSPFTSPVASLVSTGIGYDAQLGSYGYGMFGGTSAAAPEVSALAARLFEHRILLPTEGARLLVWNRIVSTLREPRGSIAGIVDYEAALEGW